MFDCLSGMSVTIEVDEEPEVSVSCFSIPAVFPDVVHPELGVVDGIGRTWKRVRVEAVSSERAFSSSSVKISARFPGQCCSEVVDKLLLFLSSVDPVSARNDEIGFRAALQASSDNVLVQILVGSPLSNAGHAEYMWACRKDSKALFSGRFLPDDLETNPAGLVSVLLSHCCQAIVADQLSMTTNAVACCHSEKISMNAVKLFHTTYSTVCSDASLYGL